LQVLTEEIFNALWALLPERPLNKYFLDIIEEGTGHDFQDFDEKN